MFRRAAGHDNLGYRSCGHWDELLSDFEFEFSLVVEIDKVCVGHRYRESLSINSIKLENKLLLNRKINKIVFN